MSKLSDSVEDQAQAAAQQVRDTATLTEQQMREDAYLASCGGGCPFCKCKDIEGQSLEVEGDHAAQDVSCSGCDREWRDIYKLVGIVEYKER